MLTSIPVDQIKPQPANKRKAAADGWKKFERRIATLFNGQRRGADTSFGRQGKTDIIAPGWAIECKLYGRPNYAVLLEAVHQVERNAENESDIPIAIVKRKGDHDKNALVIMRLETFMNHFGPTVVEENNSQFE